MRLDILILYDSVLNKAGVSAMWDCLHHKGLTAFEFGQNKGILEGSIIMTLSKCFLRRQPN